MLFQNQSENKYQSTSNIFKTLPCLNGDRKFLIKVVGGSTNNKATPSSPGAATPACLQGSRVEERRSDPSGHLD